MVEIGKFNTLTVVKIVDFGVYLDGGERGEKEMFLYATKIAKSREIDFYQVVNDDKENYLKQKQNTREDSGIISTPIKDRKSVV